MSPSWSTSFPLSYFSMTFQPSSLEHPGLQASPSLHFLMKAPASYSFYIHLYTFLLLICLCLFNFQIWPGTLRKQREISSSLQLPNEKAVTQEQRQQHHAWKGQELHSAVTHPEPTTQVLHCSHFLNIRLHSHRQSC